MGTDLRQRWDQLVDHIVAAYRSGGESTLLNFYHSFAERTIRLRSSGPVEDWVTRTLTDDELCTADLRAIARTTYAETRYQTGDPA